MSHEADIQTVLRPASAVLSFTVQGCAAPQGSKRHVGRGIMVESCKRLKPWRQEVAQMADYYMARIGQTPHQGPVEVAIRFYFTRPASAPKRVTQKITKPDVDKLSRSVFDSLTGVVFRDDSQVVELRASKHFGSPERAEIEVTFL